MRRAGALALLDLALPKQRSEEAEFAATTVERWLRACPDGPLALGPESTPALEALAAGWSSTAIHALAQQPLTTSETVAAVAPELRKGAIHAIRAMREVELLTAMPGPEEKTLAVTEWLRRGIGPLAAAARVEITDGLKGAQPIDARDVEAAFLLTLPLVGGLPDDICSSCRLIVPMPDPHEGLIGVVVQIEWGQITSISTDLTIWSDTFATGPPLAWIEGLIDPSQSKLDAAGALEVPIALIEGLHEELFSSLGEFELRP